MDAKEREKHGPDGSGIGLRIKDVAWTITELPGQPMLQSRAQWNKGLDR